MYGPIEEVVVSIFLPKHAMKIKNVYRLEYGD